MAEQLQKLNIPRPPEWVFKYRENRVAPASRVAENPQAMFVFEKMEYPESGGQFAYFEGVPFPAKGHPFPEAIYAVNAAKRFTRTILKSFTKWPTKERLLGAYVEVCNMFLPPYILHERYYSSCPLEIVIFIKNFLVEIGINDTLARQVAEVFGTQIEYDNAYRLRIEDIMTETTKELMLKNPIKEMRRIVEILGQRDPTIENTNKFKAVISILRVVFWLPKYRKAFKKALTLSEFDKFQYDEADRYHVLLWSDYNFMGLPIEARVEKYKEIHKDGLPRRIIARSA